MGLYGSRAIAMIRMVFVVAAVIVPLLLSGGSESAGRYVHVIALKGVINPVLSGYVTRELSFAAKREASAVVIQMDTPGGLESSMDEIIQAILDSDVPVICYVTPAGGRAASAGTFIVMASHVAAMAPNTTIGAASPVSLTGDMDETMRAKVTNDAAAKLTSLAAERGRNQQWADRAVREAASANEREALDQHIVDYVAMDLSSLLAQVDGKVVVIGGSQVELDLAGLPLEFVDLNWLENFLHTISDPNIAYILMIIGINGLLFELLNPGAVFPGVVGAISLLLGFFALGSLPVNFAGVGLIFLAFLLFVIDTQMPTHGILTAGGVISLVLGSMILINSEAPYFTISWWVIATVVVATAAFFVFAISAVIRTYKKRAATGREGLVGARGVARTDLNPEGMVLVQGENWQATVEGGAIEKGTSIEVVRVDGLRVVVRTRAVQ